jgi:hypothetical protein
MKYEEPPNGPWKSLYGIISPWFTGTMVETERGGKRVGKQLRIL